MDACMGGGGGGRVFCTLHSCIFAHLRHDGTRRKKKEKREKNQKRRDKTHKTDKTRRDEMGIEDRTTTADGRMVDGWR